jgi:glycosyltransferase involved in cell wall biosynthesis
MSYRIPIFIQAGIGKSADSPNQLLKRWNNYGQRVKVVTGGEQSKIVVFLPDSIYASSLANLDHLELIPFPNSLFGRVKLIRTLQQYLKKQVSHPVTFIAGDLFISPLIAILMRSFTANSSRLQIQFHGALYNEKIHNLRTYVRVKLMRFSLRASDSVRVVSAFQITEIQRITNCKFKEFVIAPIPIDQKKISYSRTQHEGLALLFLGRLHEERGMAEFKDFLALLSKSNPSCSINVVGDGPAFEDLVTFSKSIERTIPIKFYGRLDEVAINKQLSRNDLLLSFAPQEGYGLAIREAILSGLYVIAKRNSGTLEVFRNHPEQIELFDSITEAVKLIENFVPPQISEDSLSRLRKAQEERDYERVDALVLSWVKP